MFAHDSARALRRLAGRMTHRRSTVKSRVRLARVLRTGQRSRTLLGLSARCRPLLAFIAGVVSAARRSESPVGTKIMFLTVLVLAVKRNCSSFPAGSSQ